MRQLTVLDNPPRLLSSLLVGALLAATAGAQHHLYTFDGDSAGDRLGWSVGGAGDVDQDGYPDFVVGAPFAKGATGIARVFSGKDGRVLYTFKGDSVADAFGYSVGGAGDVNKDGHADLIVGAPYANSGTGIARVFSGKGGNVLHMFKGDSVNDAFGYSVGGAGDVNKDGFADLIVGGSGAKSGTGIARVFSGKDGNVLYTFKGDSASDAFGYSVGGAGDVNKDGYPDLIVGAPGTKSGTGIARVFSGKDGKVLYTFNGDSASDYFAQSVAGAGDVNKDGHADLIVGASGDDNNGRTDSGSARVFSGKDGNVLYTFNGDSAHDWFGQSVGGPGDVNNDGFADLIVGAYGDDNNGPASGSARVLSGKDGNVLYTFSGDSAGDSFGGSVGGAGDVNKDGHADLIGGAPYDGKSGSESGSAGVLSGKALTVTTDSHAFSLAKANTQTLNLDAGSAHKGRLYWVFGSVTGTTPGVTLASAIGAVTIPLSPDPWTDITIALANGTVLVNTKGTLDGSGKAKAQIKGGPVNAPSAIGLVFYHAYLVYDANNNFYLASNPVTLLLEK